MADADRNNNSMPKKPATEKAGGASQRAIWPLRHIKARPRLLISVGIMIAAFVMLPAAFSVQTRLLAAFDTGIAIYLILVFDLMMRANPERVRRRAQLEDEGRWAVLRAGRQTSRGLLVHGKI